MPPRGGQPSTTVRLRVPILVIVLAATAAPIELRSADANTSTFGIYFWDVLANVVGYVPVGIVLSEWSSMLAVPLALMIAALAEAGQLFMAHRDPSVVDVVSNGLGAFAGMLIRQGFRLHPLALTVTIRRGLAAAALGCVLIVGVWATSPDPVSERVPTAGSLSGYWKFDEASGERALDSSGHGLEGKLKRSPTRVAGVLGRAVQFDGISNYVDLGKPAALRLVGSVTIEAWINASSFPVDDSAVVSSHNGIGYQLDTTVDRGPRTIGFKLADACGHLMARYGATALVTGRWYHVAGVYDAAARTLDVFLDGKRDDGFLLGAVTGSQVSSRAAVSIGRRNDLRGAEFAGSIDEVRIYSRPLTEAEIVADMEGTAAAGLTGEHTVASSSEEYRPSTTSGKPERPCGGRSEKEDARLPGLAAVVGALAAMAATSLSPVAGPWTSLAASLVAGLAVVDASSSTVPALGRYLIVLVSLAGGAAVLLSRMRYTR